MLTFQELHCVASKTATSEKHDITEWIGTRSFSAIFPFVELGKINPMLCFAFIFPDGRMELLNFVYDNNKRYDSPAMHVLT